MYVTKKQFLSLALLCVFAGVGNVWGADKTQIEQKEGEAQRRVKKFVPMFTTNGEQETSLTNAKALSNFVDLSRKRLDTIEDVVFGKEDDVTEIRSGGLRELYCTIHGRAAHDSAPAVPGVIDDVAALGNRMNALAGKIDTLAGKLETKPEEKREASMAMGAIIKGSMRQAASSRYLFFTLGMLSEYGRTAGFSNAHIGIALGAATLASTYVAGGFTFPKDKAVKIEVNGKLENSKGPFTWSDKVNQIAYHVAMRAACTAGGLLFSQALNSSVAQNTGKAAIGYATSAVDSAQKAFQWVDTTRAGIQINNLSRTKVAGAAAVGATGYIWYTHGLEHVPGVPMAKSVYSKLPSLS